MLDFLSIVADTNKTQHTLVHLPTSLYYNKALTMGFFKRHKGNIFVFINQV